MIYKINAELTLQSDDRTDVLRRILLMQQHAVKKMGFDPANIVIVQVIESTENPVVDITSEVMQVLLATPPPPPPPEDPPPDPPPPTP